MTRFEGADTEARESRGPSFEDEERAMAVAHDQRLVDAAWDIVDRTTRRPVEDVPGLFSRMHGELLERFGVADIPEPVLRHSLRYDAARTRQANEDRIKGEVLDKKKER